MKIINIDDFPHQRDKIIGSIKNGKTVVFPFDTVYGLVSDPFNDAAIDKIYKIKGRDFSKPIALVFSSIEMLKKNILISADQEKFICQKTPGAYTFILPWKADEREKFSSHYQKLEKVGIRIPNYHFVIDFVKDIGQPIAATSANISGMPNCWSVDDFLTQIRDSQFKPDYIIDAGKLPTKPPSKVIDISDLNYISTLRK